MDIFILHNCPNAKIAQLWQCFWAKCVVVKGMSMRGYDRQKGGRQFLISFAKILPKKVMVDFALSQVYRFRNRKSKYYCNFLGKAVYKFGEEFSADYNAFNPKEDEYGFSRGIVDASLAVKDAIITDFPTQILCKPDCKGLCPKCGANLNVESYKCEI